MNLNFVKQIKIRVSVVYLLTVGFFSILGQVIILRELNVAFFGTELIYILAFAFWLTGTAVGASVGRRTYIPEEKHINTLLLISAVILILDIIFIRGIRNIFGGVPGGYLPFLIQLSALSFALLPISFLAGLLFQWSAKRFVGEKETLATAYAIESAGGVVGGLVSTLILDLAISNFSSALICSLCLLIVVIRFNWNSRAELQKYLSLVIVASIFVLLSVGSKIDLFLTSWNHPNVVQSIDTPYNRVTITAPENQICVFEDDALSYETQDVAAEEFVQLSALQLENIGDVLVLGGGFSGVIHELLKLPVKNIDYVEINKKLIEALRNYLPAHLKDALNNERVNLIHNDPRKFLKQQHSYDLILVGMPEPTSAQNNRYYTEEFFKACYEALTQDGIIAFKIRSSENIWTQQLTERNAAIYNAVKSSFSEVMVLPGVTNIFFASKSQLTIDINLLIERYKKRNLEARLVSPQYIKYVFTNDRFKEIQNLLSSNNENTNTDLQPVCYSYTISIWLSKFFPNLTYSENVIAKLSSLKYSPLAYVSIFILVAVLVFTIRKFPAFKGLLLVSAAGFVGMVLEIILILLYQNTNGILFRDIGFLLSLFMVGLSLGSYLVYRIFTKIKKHVRNTIFLGLLLILGFASLNVLVYVFINADLLTSLFSISIALLLDGIFVAGIFSFASLHKVENQKNIISRLYAADLVGGSLGSLLASLILIPLYGFYSSLIFMIFITLSSLIFILEKNFKLK